MSDDGPLQKGTEPHLDNPMSTEPDNESRGVVFSEPEYDREPFSEGKAGTTLDQPPSERPDRHPEDPFDSRKSTEHAGGVEH